MYIMDNLDCLDFELSDYLIQEFGSEEDSTSSFAASLSLAQNSSQDFYCNGNSITSEEDNTRSNNNDIDGKRIKMDDGYRIAFRTRSSIEIMDDGFKWRKYGKKMVKSSHNPRNYFRCSSKGCSVKKRVQRDSEDSSFVITTYEGKHNHGSPCVLCYNEMPLMHGP